MRSSLADKYIYLPPEKYSIESGDYHDDGLISYADNMQYSES